MDAAIGRTGVEYTDAWEFVGFTYDGRVARLYRNGCFDARPTHNPYPYPGGYDGDEQARYHERVVWPGRPPLRQPRFPPSPVILSK